MYKEKKILALIPARGNSKGLPGKNIKPLLGKPLIGWTIEQALATEVIDKVVVTTDDKTIMEISQSFGADVPFLRPLELAGDSSPTIDAIFHAVDWFEKHDEHFDILVLLEPTSPLREVEDIQSGIIKLVDNLNGANTLVSLGEIALENPYITKVVEDGYVLPLMNSDRSITQRQQQPVIYFPYGVIYAATISSLKKKKTFYQEKTIPYFIKRWQNYEIDDIYDFLCVEAILNHKSKEAK